jgi:hypothetical protein
MQRPLQAQPKTNCFAAEMVRFNWLKQFFDQLLDTHSFGLGLEIAYNAVAQYGHSHGPHVFNIGRVFAVDDGIALGTQHQILGSPRACTPL